MIDIFVRLLALPYPCFGTWHLKNWWMQFHKIWYWNVLLNFVYIFQFWIRSYSSNRHFTRRPLFVILFLMYHLHTHQQKCLPFHCHNSHSFFDVPLSQNSTCVLHLWSQLLAGNYQIKTEKCKKSASERLIFYSICEKKLILLLLIK
jgi:hypothetical protein